MKRVLVILAAAALLGGAYLLGMRGAHRPSEALPAVVADRGVLYWHDPMHPQQRFDKPGKSPFMDMQLVPVYADDKSGDGAGVSVSPRVQQNLGMRLAQATLAEMSQETRAVGYVLADERRIARVETRVAGWIERLQVRSVNEPVRAGQVLAEIYSPELLAAQEEYLLTRRMAQANPADAALAQAARRRLELLGIPESGIARLDGGGQAERRVPLLAPISGVVSELGLREGAMLQAGSVAFTLTDLSSVWIAVEVPEAQGGALRQGTRAEVRVPNLPGRVFEGRVEYVYPELNAQTRSAKARIALPNPGLALKPGMFAEVVLASAQRKVLSVPSESVIRTGTRSVVVVAEGERLRVAPVKVGAEARGMSEILEGLKPGEQVVVSGQFLIDSEASLKGALEQLEAAPAPGPVAMHRGTGEVKAVDAATGQVELDHDPIASMNWPRMTMGFVVGDRALLGGLKPGERVEFELRGEPDKDGNYVIGKLRRLP